jgi:hypothetical protein
MILKSYRLLVALTALSFILVAFAGCSSGKKPSSDMTSGHAVIGASDAIIDLARFMGRQFEATYPGAFVDHYPFTDKDLVDSLLSERTEQIFLDRRLAPEETLAFGQNGLKALQYPVAYYPVFLLAPKADSVRSIDSAALRGALTGRIVNWKALGGPNQPLRVYLPLPREGAWEALMGYFGHLDSVTAVICTTSTAMLKAAADDPGALLVFARPIDDLKSYRALKFRRGEDEIYPDAETILKPNGYPFRLNITYVTTHNKEDVAAGYLTFICGNVGQRTMMEALKYRPAAVPVKIVRKKM